MYHVPYGVWRHKHLKNRLAFVIRSETVTKGSAQVVQCCIKVTISFELAVQLYNFNDLFPKKKNCPQIKEITLAFGH